LPTNLKVWALAQSRGHGHRSLVTPERVLLSAYNQNLILLILSSTASISSKIFSQFYTHSSHWSCDYKYLVFSVNQQI